MLFYTFTGCGFIVWWCLALCFWSSKKNKGIGDGKCTPEIKSPAMIRAEEVQSNLEPDFPSFAKSLVRSHVGSCFWMVSFVKCLDFILGNCISREFWGVLFFSVTIFSFDRDFLGCSVKYIYLGKILWSFWRTRVGNNFMSNTMLIKQDWVLDGDSFVVCIICSREMFWSSS